MVLEGVMELMEGVERFALRVEGVMGRVVVDVEVEERVCSFGSGADESVGSFDDAVVVDVVG
jgi:hypothetical protein